MLRPFMSVEKEHVCALCLPPKKGENSARVAASETVSTSQTPSSSHKSSHRLYSGASSSGQGWGPQLSSLTGGSRVSTKPGAIHILPSALCLHSGFRLLWAS